jgi:hypothetical protein
MNPRGAVRGQSGVLAIVGATSCLSPLWPMNLALAGLLVSGWASLNFFYSKHLGDRPRRPARVEGDLEVARQVALVTTGCLLATAASVADIRLTESQQVAIGLLCAMTFFEAMYLSSLFDWYYIRPRRDGVWAKPPCQTSMESRWDTATRHWYRHRCVAAFVCYLAASTGVGFFALAVIGRDGFPSSMMVGSTFVASATLAGALMGRFYGSLAEVGSVFASCSISPPDHALGQRLVRVGETGGSFVRDVAVEGVVCVPLTASQTPSGDGLLRLRVADVQGNHELRRTAFTGCRFTCSRVNSECEWIFDSEYPKRKSRRWVVGPDIDAQSGRRVKGYTDPCEESR